LPIDARLGGVSHWVWRQDIGNTNGQHMGNTGGQDVGYKRDAEIKAEVQTYA